MPENRIRVSARGLVRRDDELLVARETPPGGDTPFYYPLGGGVEFGEHSEDALHREFDEELGVSLSNVSHFETYEGVFTSGGRRHHEVWRVYEADIVEPWPYERDEFTG
ncbi:NUDIX hydrolase [Haladaptatus sp. W1]|uniref:NUDIX hydrolase n=1 Tax=Haladaptatus sp. W1 TaxID=1897478 RepID=UPI000A995F85|nr:NUDIX domain-containing protein [Haladaptatus sp. W1]